MMESKGWSMMKRTKKVSRVLLIYVPMKNVQRHLENENHEPLLAIFLPLRAMSTPSGEGGVLSLG